jgi:uncharacterized membrane protein YjjB (DUF3815 family)
MGLNPSIPAELISCTIGCTGFTLMFGVRGRQVFYCALGSFFTWVVYLCVFHVLPNSFAATLIGAMFVALYAIFMSRFHKAPATIFTSTCAFPLYPGSQLYYSMYGLVNGNKHLAESQLGALVSTGIAIVMGYIFIDTLIRYIGIAADALHLRSRNGSHSSSAYK